MELQNVAFLFGIIFTLISLLMLVHAMSFHYEKQEQEKNKRLNIDTDSSNEITQRDMLREAIRKTFPTTDDPNWKFDEDKVIQTMGFTIDVDEDHIQGGTYNVIDLLFPN